MVQSALALGPAFESVPVSLARSRRLRLAGILRAERTLVEMPVVPAPTSRRSERRAGTIRAFRIQGDELNRDGLFDGDYVLVGDQKRPPAGAVVLAETRGRPVLTRATPHGRHPSASLSSPDSKVLGVFLGIIRKRGFGGAAERKRPIAAPRHSSTESFSSAPPTRARLLRSSLVMLESTCAGTSNPRLQRALQNEAELVRRQLQNEPSSN